MGMLKNFEMAKEDETAQEKWKMARKLKRQVIDSYGLKLTMGDLKKYFKCKVNTCSRTYNFVRKNCEK